MSHVEGLHHVTAISSSAQANVDFFSGVLGLRLVKTTVNFDDPGTYHLYFGDRTGSPGTALTFFPWPGARPGRAGTGEVSRTLFSVPAGSLPEWTRRLTEAGLPVTSHQVLGDDVLDGADPDGFAFRLVEVPSDTRDGWTGGSVPASIAIRGFRGVELSLAAAEPTREVLTGLLGYREVRHDGNRTRLVNDRGHGADVVDLVAAPDVPSALEGAGRVHHVAFRVPDRTTQEAVRSAVAEAGLRVTPSIDRTYFRAIYFRTPGGVLFEVATDEPGFLIDETEADLGGALMLPEPYEHLRGAIEQRLPPLRRSPTNVALA